MLLASFFLSSKFPVERLLPSMGKGDLSNMRTRSATDPPDRKRRFGALTEFIFKVVTPPPGNNEPVDDVLSKICCRCCGVSSGCGAEGVSLLLRATLLRN